MTLVIKNGTVVDGTGAPGRLADVAIDGGRVVEIGSGLSGDVELDATGCVVAPGFIDIHTHYDAQVFWDPALTPSCFHGVTTVVAGNCGFSIAPTRPEHRELIARTLENVEDMNVDTLAAGIPWEFESFPEYLDAVERRGTGLNFAAYVGHTPLRLFVMGDDAYERTATADERDRMAAVLRESLEAGAAGFATSFAPTHRGADGKPIPSRFADSDELDALWGAVADTRHGVVEVTPGENMGIDDLYGLQPRLGVPLTYTALLTMPNGQHTRQLDAATKGAEAGLDVWPQVSPRPLAFAMSMVSPFTLNQNPVFAELMAGATVDERRAAYADPSWRERALEVWKTAGGFGVPRWETYEIAESSAHPEVVGKRLTELGGEPLATLLDLAVDEPDLGLRVRCMLANDDTDALYDVLTHPHCTLGLSDAGAHVGQLCDAPQATDFLGNWVRDRKLMPIEEAVKKLTSVQASILGLTDRGELRPGAWADVVVFDFDTVAPGPIRRVRDFPADADRLTADQPSGIRHVLVNGTPIIRDGVHDADARSGQVLRSSRRAAPTT